MLDTSYLFLSKQKTEKPYLFVFFPFLPTERIYVHILDHVYARRLREIGEIADVHIDTFSGVNTLSLEMKFLGDLSKSLLENIWQSVFYAPLKSDELEYGKATTQDESLTKFYKRENLFAQLIDHDFQDLSKLEKAYNEIPFLRPAEVNSMHDQLLRRPKMVIAHAQEVNILKPVIDGFIGSGEVFAHQTAIDLPGVEVTKDKGSDFVHCEVVVKVITNDAVTYQRAVVLMSVMRDVVYTKLEERGILYDLSVLSFETLNWETYFVFTYDVLANRAKLVSDQIALTVAQPFMPMDLNDEIVGNAIYASQEIVDEWVEHELERDYNHAWQILAFGEENYRQPESIQDLLKNGSVSQMNVWKKELGEIKYVINLVSNYH